MGLLRTLGAACMMLAPIAVPATDLEAVLDLRAVYADATRSFLNGNLGKLRSDDEIGFGPSRLRLGVSQSIGETWRAVFDATLSADDIDGSIDVTEAFAEYRPYPRAGWRTRIKVGAFYAPISLENRSSGWETPYSLSSSAINSWLGEEVRTIGAELQLDWLGSQLGHGSDLGVVVGVHGWNDFAGAYLAGRGFRAQDRQTAIFGHVAELGVPGYSLEPFVESDDRPGYYLGGRWLYADRLELRALHYDNRGDATIFEPRVNDYIWHTRFDAVGLRLELPAGWTVIAQWLGGDTLIAPSGFHIVWDYDATYVLVSREITQRQRLTLRHDDFSLRRVTATAFPPNSDRGDSWTLAWLYEPAPDWRVGAEWQRMRSEVSKRRAFLGVNPAATESKLELSVRRTLRNR